MNFKSKIKKIFLLFIGCCIGYSLLGLTLTKSVYPPLSDFIQFNNKNRFLNPTEIEDWNRQRVNVRGALGSHYRNQKNFCLIIGGSTLTTKELPTQYSFNYFISKNDQDIFVENYSHAGHTWASFEAIINEIFKKDQRPNCLILDTRFFHSKFRKNDFPFHFSKQWSFFSSREGVWLWLAQFSEKFFSEFRESLFLSKVAFFIKNFIDSKLYDHGNKKYGDPFIYRKNHQMISQVDESIVEKKKESIQQYFKETIKIADKYHLKLILVTYVNSYHESEVPGVSAKWNDLRFNEQGILLDNKSLSTESRLIDRYVLDLAKEEKISVLDLDLWGQELVQQSAEYFLDRWHFSRQGMEIVGPRFAHELSKLLE